MAAPYVQVRTKRRCAAQANPTPDLTLTLTLTLTQPNPLGGSRSVLEVGRGSTEFTCKSENLARTCNETPGALEMINQQSPARSTSSRKQYKTICQLRTNTTALFPVYHGKRTKQQRSQRHHSNSKARLPHCLTTFPYSREKSPPNDAIPG